MDLDCLYGSLSLPISLRVVRADDFDEYCGPLSETTTSGIPCLAKNPLVWRITSSAVVLVSRATFMNRE